MIKWSSPEFEYYEKNKNWFLVAIIIAVIIALLALWQKNFLFLIFIIIATVMIISLGKKKPNVVDFTIDDKTLWVKDKVYNFDQFESFAIKPGSLLFKNKERFKPYLVVSFNKNDLEAIRKHLLDFLPEIEYGESLVEVLSNYLGF